MVSPFENMPTAAEMEGMRALFTEHFSGLPSPEDIDRFFADEPDTGGPVLSKKSLEDIQSRIGKLFQEGNDIIASVEHKETAS
jgi:hypothetical protein